jgi:hypothetical protein
MPAASVRWLPGFLLLLLLAFVGRDAHAEAPAIDAKPRLGVLIVFDQLRGDYLKRWDELFTEGGFHRLEREGVWFDNCHYPYSHTVTGAGHASLATGCSPESHGIVANDWYDQAAAVNVNCVGAEPADRYSRVPPPLPAGPESDKETREVKQKPTGVSPEHLLRPTIGDALKDATAGKGRIVALSSKDRGAVLLAGRQHDASCYWLDGRTGQYVTSTYYRDRLPDWVAQLNADRVADRWFGKIWTPFRPGLDYASYSGPDDVVGEDRGTAQGRTFPHPFGPYRRQPGREYYSALYNSPFSNELLLELAKRAVVAEELGTRDVPDLLTISFSSNDSIGHCWGPDSQEVLDVTLRADAIVRDLLTFLDGKVGKGRYFLVLSADHGVCPLPEVSTTRGETAERIDVTALVKRAEEHLKLTFGDSDGKGRWIETARYMPWLYLDHKCLEKRGVDAARVLEELTSWLEKQPGILKVYDRSQVADDKAAEKDPYLRAVRKSFRSDRCGDVIVIPKPLWLLYDRKTGTTHGTPHPYDTHVPLLAFGPRLRAGIHNEAVTPQAAAVILARGLQIKPPTGAEVAVPADLFTNDPNR